MSKSIVRIFSDETNGALIIINALLFFYGLTVFLPDHFSYIEQSRIQELISAGFLVLFSGLSTVGIWLYENSKTIRNTLLKVIPDLCKLMIVGYILMLNIIRDLNVEGVSPLTISLFVVIVLNIAILDIKHGQ